MAKSLSRNFQRKKKIKLFDFKLPAYPKKIKNSLNIILFVIVFLSLPKSSFGSCSSGYIELTVNQDGLTLWRGNYLNRTEETFIDWKKVTEYFILELDARTRDIETKVAKPEYNKENYYFHIGDSIFIGMDEFKILDINNEIYTVYNENFPLLQEKININDVMDKIAENPMNDYLKEDRQQTIKENISVDNTEQKELTNKKDDSTIPRTRARSNRNIEYFDLHPEIPSEERNNYRIKDDKLGVGTAREKFRNNIEAIKILKICEEQNRYATPEEQEILSKYVGWGGLKSAFEDKNDSWSKEYNELKNLLTDKEYRNARKSSLTAYYTPPLVIRNIYKALQNMGLQKANILEPSCRCR